MFCFIALVFVFSFYISIKYIINMLRMVKLLNDEQRKPVEISSRYLMNNKQYM